MNGKPFGFGYEYSENDNLVYEGFVFEGKKVCFGKEWNDNDNNNCIMYEGGYCNEERWGRGKSYDLDGNVDFEGEWINNHGMTDKEKIVKNELIVPMLIEEFVIGDGVFNHETITTLHFSYPLARLKRIAIGENSCKNVHRFEIDGLPNLEYVVIGENSFKIDWRKRVDSVCRLANCPKLHELIIDSNSFYYHQSLELFNLNSLQVIQFGRSCFSSNCILKGVCVKRRISLFRSSSTRNCPFQLLFL